MPENNVGQSDTLQKYSIPIAIVIAGALIAGAVYFSNRSSGTGAPVSGQLPAVNVKDVKIAAENPFIGDPKAKVTMIAWEDYQCPFCKAFEVGGVQGINIEPSMPMLKKDYVDAGKLRIVFKDYAFLGPDSIYDAEFARAVWELYPEKFFEWRTAMFTQQPEENSLSESQNAAHVKKVTASISGIDVNAVLARLSANKAKYDKSIADDQQEGNKWGISGTPGFITGKKLISGADTPAAFKQAIDSQL